MKIVVAMVALLVASIALLGTSMRVTIVYSGRVTQNRALDVRDVDGSITLAPRARLEIHATRVPATADGTRVRITTQALADRLLVWVSVPDAASRRPARTCFETIAGYSMLPRAA